MKNYPQILIPTVIVLILLNLLLMGIVWNGYRRQHKEPGGTPIPAERMQRQLNYLSHTLGLSKDQRTRFRMIMEDHHKQIQNLNRQEHLLRKTLHKAVFAYNQALVDSLAIEMEAIHKQKLNDFIEKAQKLSEICDPQQRKKMLKLLERFPPVPDGRSWSTQGKPGPGW